MAQQQIITKPYVGELQDDDSLFINHDGALRQVKKKDADLASSEEVAAEVAAREAFEAREVAAREAFEESETAAREAFEADVEEQMSEKANVDGYYEEMTVGDAEQLVATQFVEDNEPYLFRPTGGSSDVGNRAYLDKIIGGTVAWNQLFDIETMGTFIASTKSYDSDTGVVTVTPTNYASNSIGFYTTAAQLRTKANHVYFTSVDINPDYSGLFRFGVEGSAKSERLNAGSYQTLATIAKRNGEYAVTLYLASQDWTTGVYKYKNGKVIDLTAMFGTTIADYIYNLEQSSAGAGVAWFKKLFPASYYEYNAGELLSVEGLESHDTVGFNQWDEEWELGDLNTQNGQNYPATNRIRSKNYIRVLPSTAYYFKSPYNSLVCFYDEDKNFVNIGNATLTANAVFTTQKNVHYMRISPSASYGTVYKKDICINISNPSRNGEYEEYVKHSYPLDNSITLRGTPKLDSFNNLYYDGDEYESDGTVTRKYGIVDLSTLDWSNGSAMKMFFTTGIRDYIRKPSSNADVADWIVCDRLVPISYNALQISTVKRICVSAPGSVGIVDGNEYSTLADFKQAMSGVYLVYELATPTTEEAEPFQYTQIVDDLGTEEFVSNGFIPAGHLTEYPANLRDKLQHLPDLAGMDGTYLIRQTGNQMSLVYMPAVFPEIPTEDGTYTLETVVTGGVATLQWVAK